MSNVKSGKLQMHLQPILRCNIIYILLCESIDVFRSEMKYKNKLYTIVCRLLIFENEVSCAVPVYIA